MYVCGYVCGYVCEVSDICGVCAWCGVCVRVCVYLWLGVRGWGDVMRSARCRGICAFVHTHWAIGRVRGTNDLSDHVVIGHVSGPKTLISTDLHFDAGPLHPSKCSILGQTLQVEWLSVKFTLRDMWVCVCVCVCVYVCVQRTSPSERSKWERAPTFQRRGTEC